MGDTIHARPLPKRPANGLLAWQATIAYISNEYSADASLSFRAYPQGKGFGWGASVSWSGENLSVRDFPALGLALEALWLETESRYDLLKTPEALARRPAEYRADQWLDAQTEYILERLLQTTARVFDRDWALALFYQPIEQPAARVHGFLMAKEGKVRIRGQGPALEDACRDLFRSAAKDYAAFSKSE